MCWNKQVSFNTFIFGILSLLFVYYNNHHTQYKLTFFRNTFVYLLFLSFISMQLLEYWIWNDIHNSNKNKMLSMLQILLVLTQPFFSIMSIESNNMIKSKLLKIYLVFVIAIIFIYCNTKHNMSVTVADNGHLKYNWIPTRDNIPFVLMWCFYFVFLLYPLYYEKNYFVLMFLMITLFVSVFTYLKYRTYESMWCWISNTIMILCVFAILFYLPYKEKSCL